MRPIKDSEGTEIKDGDLVRFSYGIPPVPVTARIVLRNDELIALTPGHNPGECRLRLLKKYVGYFYKVEEFARRAALNGEGEE